MHLTENFATSIKQVRTNLGKMAGLSITAAAASASGPAEPRLMHGGRWIYNACLNKSYIC